MPRSGRWVINLSCFFKRILDTLIRSQAELQAQNWLLTEAVSLQSLWEFTFCGYFSPSFSQENGCGLLPARQGLVREVQVRRRRAKVLRADERPHGWPLPPAGNSQSQEFQSKSKDMIHLGFCGISAFCAGFFFPQVSLEFSKLFYDPFWIYFFFLPPLFSVGDQVNQSQLPAVILNFSRLLGSMGAQFELQMSKIPNFIGKEHPCPPSPRENTALLPFWSRPLGYSKGIQT